MKILLIYHPVYTNKKKKIENENTRSCFLLDQDRLFFYFCNTHTQNNKDTKGIVVVVFKVAPHLELYRAAATTTAAEDYFS